MSDAVKVATGSATDNSGDDSVRVLAGFADHVGHPRISPPCIRIGVAHLARGGPDILSARMRGTYHRKECDPNQQKKGPDTAEQCRAEGEEAAPIAVQRSYASVPT